MKDEINEIKINKKVQLKLKDHSYLLNQLMLGKQVKDILEFSPPTLLKFYQTAYRLLTQHKSKEAVSAFTFLVTLSPDQSDYWRGLGMALQLSHSYEEAIDAYEMAAIYRIEDPWPYFYLAKCLFAIHDRKSALQALELCLMYAEEAPEYEDLVIETQKAMLTLKNL